MVVSLESPRRSQAASRGCWGSSASAPYKKNFHLPSTPPSMNLPMAASWAFMVVLFHLNEVAALSASECQTSDTHSAALLQRETNQKARGESSEEEEADEELEVVEHDKRSVSGWARRRAPDHQRLPRRQPLQRHGMRKSLMNDSI